MTTTFDIEFTRDGNVYKQQQVTDLLAGLSGANDLLVVSHGWNNDMKDARDLYGELLGSIEAVRSATRPGDSRKIVVAQVFWPSAKFAEKDLIPAGGVASADAPGDANVDAVLDALANQPQTLPVDATDGNGSSPPADRAQLAAEAKVLSNQLDTAEKRAKYVASLRALATTVHADDEEDGAYEFFNADPEALFDALIEPVPLSTGSFEGGAASLAGDAVGWFGDLYSGVSAAARRLANLATYYEMKARAGLVGSKGLASVLHAVRQHFPELKIHLAGHSFGARLVTAAAHEFPANTNKVTLALLQGAYSHNGLAKNYADGKDGFFRRLLSESRISGPTIITHTKNDLAVGVAYPIASRIAQQVAAALGDANDPYGGMGRNGAQHTPEAVGNACALGTANCNYSFACGKVYNLNADQYITGHSDITGPQVAGALLAMMYSI